MADLRLGLYSKMKGDPLAYHGFEETKENIEFVINEVETELNLRPQDCDPLLDIWSDLQKRLKAVTPKYGALENNKYSIKIIP